jgi:hypothetical protein
MNHRWEFTTKSAHVSFAREAKQSIARKPTGLFRRCGDDDARRLKYAARKSQISISFRSVDSTRILVWKVREKALLDWTECGF